MPRCRDCAASAGLYLLGLNERALHVHPKAVEKDAEFRAASEPARAAAAGDGLTLARTREAFLTACQARPPSAEPKRSRPSAYPKSYEVGALRETHGKAYALWTKAEESDLERRHHQGETIEAIAAGLSRKPGAIRSRLKKLALI